MGWNETIEGRRAAGWNGGGRVNSPSQPGCPRPHGRWRGVVAGLIVVGGAAVVCWLLFDHPAPSKSPQVVSQKEDTVREVRRGTLSRATPEHLPPVVPPRAARSGAPARLYRGVEVVGSSVSTNADGSVVERLRLADGRTARLVTGPKRVFDSPSDQVIAMALSAKPGEPLPPLPLDAGIEGEFLKSLEKPIEIEEDDSEEVQELKARVMEARAHIAREIESGRSFRQVLNEHRREMERIADSRLMAVREIQKVRSEQGEEAAREFRSMVNESMRARGLPELETPRPRGEEKENL